MTFKSKSKYGNVGIYINKKTLEECSKADPYAIYFSSLLEFRVYKVLTKLDCLIDPQHSILIAPQTNRFPAIYWRCDFRIFSKTNDLLPSLNIEAKGLSLESFLFKLNLLDRNFPRQVDNLIIVIENDFTPIPAALNKLKANNQIVSLHKLHQLLTNKGY